MRNLFSIFLVAIAITIISCSGSKPLTMQLQPVENNTFFYVVRQNTQTGVQVMGMDQQTTSEQTTKYRYDVQDVQPNGNIDLKMTIEEMQVDQVTPMAAMSYNSEKPEESQPAEYGNAFKNIIGETFAVLMNPNGKILNIKGGENIFEGVFDSMGEQAEMMEQQMKAQFGSEAMAQGFSQMTGFYPDKPIKVGDSWTKIDTIRVGMELMLNNTYTLRERRDGKATIDVSGTLKTNPNGKGMEMMGMTMNYDMAGTQTGTIVADEKTGWAINSEMTQEMKGKINTSGGPVGNMTADMTMEGKTVIEQIEQ